MREGGADVLSPGRGPPSPVLLCSARIGIQIRNVPDDIHRKLKARAAEKGMSLSDYLLDELRPIAELPTLEEWVRRVRGRKLYRFEKSTAEIIREEREARERQLVDRS